MKNTIQFTKIRGIAFALSLLVIASGIAGIFIRGFNLGIDFQGGLSQQIQFADVALQVEYSGTGSAQARVLGGQLIINIQEVDSSISEKLVLADYDSIDSLASAISEIPGLTAVVKAKGGEKPSVFISSEYMYDLSSEPFLIRARIAENEAPEVTIDSLRTILADLSPSIQTVGNPLNQEFAIKLRYSDIMEASNGGADNNGETEDADSLQLKVEEKIVALLETAYSRDSIVIKQRDFVGPSISQELMVGALVSVLVAIGLILIYISIRFRFGYAIAATTALVHDVFIMIGVIALVQVEVTATTIAAILTIIGYSLNDTIVVFDRIRENMTLLKETNRASVIDMSITQSLSRTLITSITTLLAVVSIYIFGTGVIKDFAFNLIIGIVVGTYSSIFIASPVYLAWQNSMDVQKAKRLNVKPIRQGGLPIKQVKEEEGAESTSEESDESGSDGAVTRMQNRKKKKRKK
ncbi:MAG: protein translocase subunit SecF [Spirochaetales bacterium]|nr:protein translocase subunit SecF [Spirochaetales bacterium]